MNVTLCLADNIGGTPLTFFTQLLSVSTAYISIIYASVCGVFAIFVCLSDVFVCLCMFYVEMDLLLCFSASALSSSVRAHGWIFPLPNKVKTRAPQALIPAATQNTFLQPARV